MKKKNWDEIYEDNTQTANTLTEAKRDKKKFYKHLCPKHGRIPYSTLDNSCPHCCTEGSNRRRKLNKKFNRQREQLNTIKRRAKARDIKFTLTLDYVRSVTPIRCPVLGILLEHKDQDDSWFDTSPSIDRLDPTKGYTKENIHIISTRANRLKNNGTPEEHLQIALWQLRKYGKSDQEILTMLQKLLKQEIEIEPNQLLRVR